MADVIVRGMEMPQGCRSCPFYAYDGDMDYYCLISSDNEPCPLVQLPPHGRLIDADEIVAEMEKKGTELDKIMELCKRVGDMENYFRCSNNQTEIVTFVRMLKNAPTIVPAEGGGEDG